MTIKGKKARINNFVFFEQFSFVSVGMKNQKIDKQKLNLSISSFTKEKLNPKIAKSKPNGVKNVQFRRTLVRWLGVWAFIAAELGSNFSQLIIVWP